MRWYCLLATMLLLTCAETPLSAATVNLGGNSQLEIQGTVGAGPDRSFLVVDFGNNGGESIAFEYRFDARQNVSAQIAWSDVVSQTDLDWSVMNFGSQSDPDLFVSGFEFHGNAETPDFGVSSQSWSYWLGNWNAAAMNVDWLSSSTGMRDRVLTAGAFDGWRVTGYDPVTFDPLSKPVAPVSTVPEPVMPLTLGLCALACILRHRGRI